MQLKLQFHIKGALPLHHQVMPNYFFVIYTTVLLLCTPSLGEFNIYDSLNKSAPVCNSTVYSSCYLSDIDNSTLTQGTNISYDGSLISKGGRFMLGFFERDEGAYLGIWYYNTTNPESEEVIVWVANRDDPIPSQQQHSCYLALGEDGIARLLDSNGHTYWSTGNSSRNILSTAILLRLSDTGNLMLMVDRGTRSGAPIWQSFDNPTDTLLQGQGFGFINKENLNLKSWNGSDNPVFYNLQYSLSSSGQSFSISRIIGNSTSYYWKSSFSSLPFIITSFIQNETTGNSSQRLVMNVSGRVQLWELDQTSQRWSTLWMAPTDQCDTNLVENCASFGLCDADNGFKCKCLPGFEPTYPQAWESKDFSYGCSRRRSTSEACGKMFLSLPMTKVPPNPVVSVTTLSEDECEKKCTFYESCKCKGYSYDPSAQSPQSNCQIWLNNDLNNIQEEYYNPRNLTLSIRVADSDIDFGKRACKICGSNVIPYPLSTSVNCGDPNYLRFQCNASNGQVYFESPIGKLYKISHFSPADMRKFVVQLPQQDAKYKCDDTNTITSKTFKLNVTSPFKVTKCSIVALMDKQVVEVELSWQLPPPPACNSTADCEDWPNTWCNEDANRTKVCTCIQGFHSDSKFMSCTKEINTNSPHHKIVSLWLKAGVASACGILLLLGVIWFILHLRKRRTTTKRKGITEFNKDNDIEDIDIPFVDYESIVYATDNFSDANKLGVGGFGPVYKGLLVDGKAIAVKRLSATSVQGTEEFRNEVLLIAKLQHRNLVRLLGYCLKEDEKILIYEYMPNKSLDAFLFDLSASPVLDWRRRFNIIMGITRGLLYLHQDSRLRIIHRDLKPSNILLDEDWNPKISDFGLARIVQGNDMATTTARVIGTHGYMSPEYALDGYFSVKSDVYSFGIVVLEIISGKRCTSLLGVDNNLISLLGYAWVLWDKGNPLELVDVSVESYDSCEVKRCINVGLLCVQEDPSDRPAMSNVLSMLSGDNTSLSYPKQPIFAARRRQPSEATSSSDKYGFSSKDVTVTLEGR